MSAEPSYFLIPASSGLCADQSGGNGNVSTADVDGRESSQWYIEREKESDKIAFRNGASGQYLRLDSDEKGSDVSVGERQYFTLEVSSTPNAFWLKSASFPDAYLCNKNGYCSPNNPIVVWTAAESRMRQTMLWYISDFQSWLDHKNFPRNKKRSSSELEAKERGIREREQEIERRLKEINSSIEGREQALKEREKAVEARERALGEIASLPNGGDTIGSKSMEELQRQLAEQKARAERLDKQLKQAEKTNEDLRRDGNGNGNGVDGSEESDKINGILQSPEKPVKAATMGKRSRELDMSRIHASIFDKNDDDMPG